MVKRHLNLYNDDISHMGRLQNNGVQQPLFLVVDQMLAVSTADL